MFSKKKDATSTELPEGKSLSVAYAMKRKAKKMAEGGMVTSENQGAALKEDYDGDHIDEIMKRMQMMSEGGRVANDTGDNLAGFKENEFDDLVLRDDLEPTFDGPGNELGDEQESADRQDMVSEIMRRMSMRDKNPRVK